MPPPTRLALGDRGRASLALVGAAFLFGTTFLVVQDAVEVADPLPFLAVRFAFGLLVLAPLAWWRGRRPRPHEAPPTPGLRAAGVRAGFLLAAGYVLQTVGLQYTTSSVSAFLTYLLVVFVPLLVAVTSRRPPPATTAAGVALAVAGLALIGGGEGLGAGRGEVLTLACALAFAGHIIVLGDLAPRFDIVRLNLVQFATVAAVLAVPGLVLGGYRLPAAAWAAAAYTGVTVTALAFSLQAYGQRRVSATRTALLLLLEPVFAAALGFAAGERLGGAGALGALLILGGILVSELVTPVVPRPEDA